MDGPSITRRDFLKILGYGTIAVGLGSVLKFTSLPTIIKDFGQSTSAQSSGSWALGTATTCVAIHSAILPNGKVFYMAGSGYHRDRPTGPFEARLYDPITNTEKDLPLSEDLFCIGLTNLPEGNVLMMGGTLMYDTNPDNCNGLWHGPNYAYELDVSSESLVKVTSMSHGRWYPTAITLPDGRIFVLGGLDEYGVNNTLVEIYEPTSKTWTISYNPNAGNTYCVGAGQTACAGAGSPCYGGPNHGVAPIGGGYPRLHLMPSGLVVYVGGSNVFRTWNPADGSWGGPITQNRTTRSYGTSFLLPLHNNSSERGKVLVCGGTTGATSTTNPGIKAVEILDFDAGTNTNPVVRSVPSTTYGRRYLTPIILPTGKLVIFGGTAFAANNVPVYIPEMFDPVTETWQTLPAASVPRVYHQSAVLLTDGRVRTQGGTPSSGNQELRTEIFSPDYIFSSSRPIIANSPVVGDYGGTITISTPDPTSIATVSLVRLMATTHHYDANQRLIWLQIVSTGSNSLTVLAPLNSRIAPPGYYMIFILNASGIPSVSKVIKIPGTGGGGDTTPPSQVGPLTITPVGNTQLNLSWAANTEPDLDHYNVYRGTTPGFTVTLGTTSPVGVPTTNSFSDTGLTGATTYYYKVSAVDTSGNIGPLSAENSGTTAAGDPVFYNVPIPGDGFGVLEPGNALRFGEEANLVSSLLVGKPLKTWKVRLRKRNSPSGNITAKVRRRSDDAIVATFNELINSASLDASFAEYTFTLTTPYTIAVGDKIMIEYGGPSGVEMEVWLSDKFDGANTRRVRYTTTYGTSNTADVTGSMSGATSSDITPPGQVAPLTVTPISATQLNLSWTANTEPDLDHYNVYRGTTPGFTVTLGTTTPVGVPTTNSYSDTGLTAATTYYYKVSAVDASGNIGPLSAENSGTTLNPDTTPPGQVAPLTITPISTTQLNLSWAANTEPDLNHYNVYRGTTPGFTVTLGTTTPVGVPTTNSYSDTGLTAATTYYYKVSAVDASGNIGPLSAENSGTTASVSQVFYNVPIPGDGSGVLEPGNALRYGEEANTVSSLLVGKSLKTWQVRLRKRNSPSGNITAKVRRRSDDAIVATFNETVNSATLGTAFAEYTFTLTTPYTIAVGDRIMIEYGGPSGVEMEVWLSDKFDGANTRRVRFTNAYGTSNTADVTGTMSSATSSDTTPPGQVGPLTVTPISDIQIDLSWAANTEPDLNHYNVYRGTTPGFTVTLGTTTPVGVPTTNSYSDTGLTAATTYYYKVSAVDASGNIGPLSAENSGTTLNTPDTTPPGQVGPLTVTPISDIQIDLSWAANTEPDLNHYNVYRGTTPGFTVTLGTTTPVGVPTTNSYSDTGLTAATTYYYKVSAVDASGNIGPLSAENSGTTLNTPDTTPPGQVGPLTVTPISDIQIDLSWAANTEPDLNHYNVYRGTTPGFTVTLGTTTPVGVPTTNSYSDTGLTAATTYYYKVSAVDASGNIGPLSAENSGTTLNTPDTTPPGQVGPLTVTPISDIQIDLSWAANTEPDLNHYNVYRGTTPGFTVTLGTTTPVGVPTTNSYSDTGLTAATTYYYKVSAVDASGNIGPLSAENSGTTLNTPDTTPPGQVGPLTVTPISDIQIDLSWAANTEPDLNHYNVYRGTTPGFTVTLGTTTPVGVPTTNSYSDTGLTAATTYYYKVSAVDASGNIGPLSAENSGTTLNTPDTTPPGQVGPLTITPISTTQLNLSWAANTEPDLNHYNVYRGTTPGFTVTLGTTTPVGVPTTNSYSDTGLTAATTYYYKVSAVDASGNIGPLSAENSGTTASVSQVFYNVPIPGDGSGVLEPGNALRYGEEANTVSSLLVGKSLKTWQVRLRKRNSPSGNITAKVRRRSDDAIVATFNETVNSATLGTAFAEYTFTLTTPYTIAVGDRIMIEYGGPSGVEMEVWLSDKFDGANTRRVRFTTTYATSNTADVTGTMST